MFYRQLMDYLRNKVDYHKAKIMGKYDLEIEALNRAIEGLNYEINQDLIKIDNKKLRITKLELDVRRLETLRVKYGGP